MNNLIRDEDRFSTPTGESELVMVIKHPEGKSLQGGHAAITDTALLPLKRLLDQYEAELTPIFDAETEIDREKLRSTTDLAAPHTTAMSHYYHVQASERDVHDLLLQLNKQETIEAAYLKPPTQAPVIHMTALRPAASPATTVTPNFSHLQNYLDSAPIGIDARWAWTQAGGRGAGVAVIDIEGAWRLTHEDLLQNQGGVISGSAPDNVSARNHGTAVLGVLVSDSNAYGTTGICPDASAKCVSTYPDHSTARAISQAARMLRPGDIMLLEVHRPGPRYKFELRRDQKGFIAVEWWPDDFEAIRYATSRGIIVVEAAGNGSEDLSDALYDRAPAYSPYGRFPMWWLNPFRRSPADSGAIIVGAGAPPPGVHNQDHGPDRSRLDFSNYGSVVDAQAWGREVTTTGYSDLQGGDKEDRWYTNSFSGTSSASPIVAGVLACVQGTLLARGKPLLTPNAARQLLRSTGSPQQDAPGRPSSQRIGNRPDLKQLISKALTLG